MKMISKAYWNIFVFLALGIPTWTQFTLGLSLVSKDIESRNIKNSVYTHQNVNSVSYKNDIGNHRNFLSLEPQKLSREWVTENIFTHIEVLHTVNSTSPCYFIDKSLEFMICENSAKIEPDHIPAMLTYLHVRNVELSSLEELSLRNKSINVLLVTNTKITNITRSDLTGLADIKYLHLGGNLIQAKNSIFQSFFANFQDLTNLTHLDLSKNSISLTDVDEYQKNEDLLHNLESISFAGNPIRTLERNIFFTIRNSRLKRLDFSDCELTHIDPYTFQHLDFLEELELKENGGLFKLDPNHSPLSSALYYLPSNTFSYLGLARSELLITPTASLFVAKNSLRKLDFSSNLFFGTFLKYSILPYLRCLEELILSKNYISDIKENAFQHLGRLEVLNMSHNSLLTVPQAVQIPNIKTLDLSFQCAWYAQPYCLSNYIQLNLDSFRGMDNLENLHIKGISMLTPDMLSGAGQIVLLDISSHYLTSIQENSFKNMTKLRSLTCSQCWLLNPVPLAAWMDLKDITYLDFSYSPMSVIPAGRVGSRSGGYEGILENIKVLDLTCSMVGENICQTESYEYESPLDPTLLNSMLDLEDLNLSKNGLTTWNERRFSSNKNLRRLNLAFNKFKALSPAMLEDIKSLEYINLMTHPTDLIICDVQVVNFYKWSLERGNLTYIEGWKGGKGYTCDDISNNRVKSFEEFALNYVEPKQPVDHTLEGILAGVCLSVVSFCLGLVYSYRQRFYITFWIMKARRRYRAPVIDRPPPYYDVFVSYSEKDSEWVHQHLLKEMEQSPPILNICVHQRDFKIGVSVIENIVESVENSKMFLLILSNGFLESRWCRFETYVATHLLRDNMDDIVVIMKEVLNLNPDKNISFLIQTKTYLEYSETQEFWNRLKYSICKHKTSKGLPSHPSNPRNQSRLTYQADNPDTSSQLNEYQEVTKL